MHFEKSFLKRRKGLIKRKEFVPNQDSDVKRVSSFTGKKKCILKRKIISLRNGLIKRQVLV